MEVVAFRRVNEPYGWMSNMSPHPIKWGGYTYRTSEHLFQCYRLVGESRPWPGDAVNAEAEYAAAVRKIRECKSPMAAKMTAKTVSDLMVVQPRSPHDLYLMRTVIRAKLAQYPHLRGELVATGGAKIIEDATARPNESGLFWGAAKTESFWIGQNWLGRLWMELRLEIAKGRWPGAPSASP